MVKWKRKRDLALYVMYNGSSGGNVRKEGNPGRNKICAKYLQ